MGFNSGFKGLMDTAQRLHNTNCKGISWGISVE